MAVQPPSNQSTHLQSQQHQLLGSELKLPTWARDGFRDKKKQGGSRAGGVLCVGVQRELKLCSGLFNQEGPGCDLWAVCRALGLCLWLLLQGVVVARQQRAGAVPGLVWAPVRAGGAGVRPGPVPCTARIPEISTPLPEPSPPLPFDS